MPDPLTPKMACGGRHRRSETSFTGTPSLPRARTSEPASAKPIVARAGGHLLDRIGRALAAQEGHVEAGFLVVAHLARDVEVGVASVEAEVG